MSRRITPTSLDKGQGFLGLGPSPTFGPFMVCLRTAMTLADTSFSLLVYYNERVYNEASGLLGVDPSTTLDLVGSNQFLSCPMAMSFFLKSVSCRLLSYFINAGKIRCG